MGSMNTTPATAVPDAAPEPAARDVPDAGEQDRSRGRTVSPTAATAALLGGGILGRVALQHVPSVEPLVAAAVAAGFYGTWRHGAFVGAAGFVASNALVWGGQGSWTLFQATGAAGAGVAGAMLAAAGTGRLRFVAALVLGTATFEAAVNAGSLAFMPFGTAALMAAVPFTLMHLGSTIGFGLIIDGWNTHLDAAFGGLAGGRGGSGAPGRGHRRTLDGNA